jgi:hypothetical protein
MLLPSFSERVFLTIYNMSRLFRKDAHNPIRMRSHPDPHLLLLN